MNIRILRDNLPDVVVRHETGRLSQSIWLSEKIPPTALCGGVGRCGRCRVRFVSTPPAPCEEERDILGEEQIARGWRLACRCRVPEGEVVLSLPVRRDAGRAQPATALPQSGSRDGESLWAFDLGTTSIAWRALDARSGEVLSEGQCLNPQAGAGSDVISRIAYAQRPEGRALLARLVRDCFRERMEAVAQRPRELVVAGNTAMGEILLGEDLTGLAHAPYFCAVHGNETRTLEGLPPVYLPPLAAPFVGGDVSAGIAFLEAQDTPMPCLLADLGTNGEIALLTPERLYLTSVPLGPALEGIGLECGALAGADVITRVALSPPGLVPVTADGTQVTEQTPCQGISATGYLSLIAILRKLGLMDAQGHFAAVTSMPLARRVLKLVETDCGVKRIRLHPQVWMSARDVEEILKVKAAFAVAVSGLLARAGLVPAALKNISIAGALGKHVDAAVLEALGFVPEGTAGLVRAVGNSSLEGACLLARDRALRARLAERCNGAVLLTPAQEKDFHTAYVQAMYFGPKQDLR